MISREVADSRTPGIFTQNTACFQCYSMNRDSVGSQWKFGESRMKMSAVWESATSLLFTKYCKICKPWLLLGKNLIIRTSDIIWFLIYQQLRPKSSHRDKRMTNLSISPWHSDSLMPLKVCCWSLDTLDILLIVLVVYRENLKRTY